MSVSNNQPGDENTFNNAFASKSADNTLVGNQNLNDADAASGTNVTNVQREHNSVASYVGKAINALKDILPTWTSTAVGTGTDNLTQRAEALTVESALNEKLVNKGVALGYAELDATGKVPSSQLTVDAFQYLGTYDANTNTPTLVDATGNTGDLYRCTVAGTQDFGSGNITFAVGDKVVYNPSAVWEKWDTDDSDKALQDLSNLTSPTAVNQVLNTLDINVVGEVGINTAPVTDVPLSIQASVTANNGIMTWTDSQGNDTWEWGVYDNGYLSLIKNGLTIRSLFINAQGEVGIGGSSPSGKLGVQWGTDVIQMSVSGAVGQTASLLDFMNSANAVISSVNADGSSTWPQVDVLAEGEVRFQDATGGEYMGLKAPTTVTASTTLTLPDGAGAIGEVLTTNGTDTLSWAAAGGGDLWSDPVDSAIVPDNDVQRDLGSSTKAFRFGWLYEMRKPLSNTKVFDVNSNRLFHSGNNVAIDFSSATNTVFSVPVNMNTTNKIINLAEPTLAQDAATKNYVDTNIPAAGATPELDNLGTTAINADLIPALDAQRAFGTNSKAYARAWVYELRKPGSNNIVIAVNDHILRHSGNNTAVNFSSATNTVFSVPISMNTTNKIINLAEPTLAQDAATKNYVDSAAGGDLWSDPVDSDIVPDGANTRDLGTNGNRFAQAHVDQYRITDGTFKGLIRATAIGMPSGDTTGVLFNARENLRLALYTIDNATADAVATGGVNIETGNKSAGTGNSGDVKLYVGTSLGGTRGKINLVDGSEGTIGHVWKSDNVNGGGSWQAESGGASFPLLAPNGTNAAPSYSFSGDTDTGMYANGTTSLRWSQAGTAAMEMTSTSLRPQTGGNMDLGGSSNRWNKIFGQNFGIMQGTTEISTFIRTATPSGVTASLWQANTDPLAIVSDDETVDSTNSHALYIESGNVTGLTSNSGDINLRTGTATQTRGKINLVDGSEGTIGHVWKSDDVNGGGSWQAESGGGGGATTELDNLGTTAVNADLRMDLTKTVILPNNTYLKSRNNADSLDLDMFKVSTAGVIQSSGDLLPVSSAVFDLGAAATRWAEVHATTGYLRNIQPTISGSTPLNLLTVANTVGTGNIILKSGNASAGNSGEVRLESGTATGTRGQVVFSASQINHSQVTSTQVVWENGATGSRPGSPVTAQRFFDTTLGQPIWYDGTNWVDAQGVTV